MVMRRQTCCIFELEDAQKTKTGTSIVLYQFGIIAQGIQTHKTFTICFRKCYCPVHNNGNKFPAPETGMGGNPVYVYCRVCI